GFMLAALILLTVFLGIWQNSNPALNTDLSGIWVIIIAAASGLVTFIGTTLMSVGEGFKR
ncbi:MAG: hypothetical protein ACTSSN_11060, partial [Candidatus Heimdallarchaeaceae archaeon]